jgi:V8-like Glu-specific endopeptidase
MPTKQAAVALVLTSALAAQGVDPESTTHYFDIDSGYVQNNVTAPAAVGVPQVVWSTVVTVQDASWLRLEYEAVVLSGSPDPGKDGSFLRLTSVRDGAVQTQHLRHVGEWQQTSAYFNGGSVLVELLAQPGTGNNRFLLKSAIAGPAFRGQDSICGPNDDRTPSGDDRVGRLEPIGCTAWLIQDCNHCLLSAGHCVGGSSAQVVEFNVPLSNNNGTVNHPPPSDQYAVDPASMQDNGGQGIGDDWAYFGCFDNSTTGLSAYAAQGNVAFDLIGPPSVGSQNIRITGYGTTSSPISPTWNQAQKTHSGPYNAFSGTAISYVTDTTGGNSGSPVILDGTNNAIGIHTHAGCSLSGGANNGTGSNNAGLQAALANPQGVCVCGPGGGPQLSTTFASNNGGSVGGAVYFSLEALTGSGGVTISDLDLNCDVAAGTPVSIDVYVQPNNGSCSYDIDGVWVLRTSGAGTASGIDVPTNFALGTPLQLGEGCCLGVAVVANGFAHSYTNGVSNPEVYSNADLQLTAGRASNVPFTLPGFEPRVVNTNIFYALGGNCDDTAVAETYGAGCVETFTSFYEYLTQAGMDLSGLEIFGTATTGGHTVNTRPATILAIGSLGAATQLNLGDDDSVAAGTLGLHVGSNGWVARGPGNSNGFVPDVTTMLSNPSEGYYAWTDLQPDVTASGKVWYEESGTQWMVTYDGVYLWSTSDPVTIQFRGNEANGNFVISFGALGNTGPEDWLVGKSGAGVSNDPGPRNLSAASPFGFLAADIDREGLELTAIAPPVLGAPFQLQTSNIPPTAVFHVGIVGVQQLTLPLAFAFPSANLNCSLHASLDLILGPDVVFGGSGTQVWEGVDLTTVSALGANLYFQSATLDLSVLSDTTRTSNGVAITTGLY